MTGRQQTARAIEERELELIGTQIHCKRQEKNHLLFESFQGKYLRLRPVAMTKYRKMI